MGVKSNCKNYIFIGSTVVLLIGIVLLWNLQKEKDQLSEQTVELSRQLTMLEKQAEERNIDIDIGNYDQVVEQEETEIIITEERVDIDEAFAQEYFTPAFEWTSGEQYDEMREHYVRLLGEDSSFIQTYIVEDIKIDTNEGELSFIDHNDLKSKMDSFAAIPIEVEGKDRIRYVAFIVHYMHKDESDLVNLDALNESEAIVEFTIIGEGNSENREIVDVEAWNLL